MRGFMTNFFFFQAEDGIRDLYVTGVQTCALPICVFAILLEAMPAAAAAYVRERVDVLIYGIGAGPEEIGRASCRERVEISVVAASLKKKTRHNEEIIVQHFQQCCAHNHNNQDFKE